MAFVCGLSPASGLRGRCMGWGSPSRRNPVEQPPTLLRKKRRVGVILAVANPISPSDTGVRSADHSEDDLREAFRLWERCARELPERAHVPVRDELDELESTSHLVLKERGRVVAAGRLHWERDNVRLSRIAVAPTERGKGYGRRLVLAMLRICQSVQGVVYVKAHTWELGFYSLLGFDGQGKAELEDPDESSANTNGHFHHNRVVPERTVHRIVGSHDLAESSDWPLRVRTMVYHPPDMTDAALHHVGLTVKDIEQSLGFYGSIGFTLTEKFTLLGCRACYLEGYCMRLKLEEAPPTRQERQQRSLSPLPSMKIVIDVTKKCTDLSGHIAHLIHRSGGAINVAVPPGEHVLGRNVIGSATILDPDGYLLEFIRQEAFLPAEMVQDVSW